MADLVKTLFVLCCPMRGSHENVSLEELQQIMGYLKNMPRRFELVTDHQVKEGSIEADDAEPNVYRRENKRLDQCGFVACEISDPSDGVGGQAVYAEQNRIPLLLLAHRRVPEEKVSKYMRDMALPHPDKRSIVLLEYYGNPLEAFQHIRVLGNQIRPKE